MEKNFVEARLHTDYPKYHGEQIDQLFQDLAGRRGNPIFVVLDPSTEKEVARVEGFVKGELLEVIANPRK
jgi:hypothetical protein